MTREAGRAPTWHSSARPRHTATLSGLAPLDLAVIATYIAGVVVAGRILARKVSGQSDFFLAGRRLGKPLQFFLNFGNTADPSTATATTSSVYVQGAGGGWLGLISLFQTPYYWFMNVWFRRTRLVTMADLFEARFGGRFLAILYSATAILTAIVAIAFADVAALKTLQPIVAKPESALTLAERRSVGEYGELCRLRGLSRAGSLAPAESAEYDSLRGLYERGAIGPYVSYARPALFLPASALLVAVFVSLGGLRASAVIGVAQALFVTAMSLGPIPLGLARIGGFHGLHARLPAQMFDIFRSGAAGEYTWYSILAFQLAAFLGTNASSGNMNISGAARTEEAARFGAVGATLAKRLMTIAWCLCGLVGAALFVPALSDPDQAWGLLAHALFPQGLLGIAIAGILGGMLSYAGSSAVVVSSLVVKNLYEPRVQGRPQAHYVAVARIVVFAILAAGASSAVYLRSATALMKLVIALTVAWGAPIVLIFLWRRLTEAAVRIQVIVTVLFVAVIPWIVTATPSLRRSESLTRMTAARTVVREAAANAGDVREGRAMREGERILRREAVEPVPVFFEEGVARIDPRDPGSPREGLGRFSTEIFAVSLLGIDVTRFTAPMLLAVRYLVDALVPLALLFTISLATRPAEPGRTAGFYARLKTPVAPTPEADAAAVAESVANPSRFDHLKLFPHSNWELTKWSRRDAAGFLLCAACVLAILGFFEFVVRLGG